MLQMTLKNLICPNKCMVCQTLLDINQNQYTCVKCETSLLERDVCDRCGKPYAPILGECMHCHQVPNNLLRVLALFPYIDLYKESVLRWKYTGIRKYAKGYAHLIVSELIHKEGLEIDGFIPIPISYKRYKKRGFNQALDLAKQLEAKTDIPVYDVLERCKETKPQSACKKEERARNIRGAIHLKSNLPLEGPVSIAFVDDIYTTGSTIYECIRAMKETKVQINKIYVLTVCLAI